MILNSKMQRLVSSSKFMVSLKISKLINHSILVMIKSNWDRSVQYTHRRTGHGSLGSISVCANKDDEYLCVLSVVRICCSAHKLPMTFYLWPQWQSQFSQINWLSEQSKGTFFLGNKLSTKSKRPLKSTIDVNETNSLEPFFRSFLIKTRGWF